MTLKTFSRAAVAVLLGLLLYTVPVPTQTATTSTTLSSAVTSTSANTVVLASATNVDAGGAIYVGSERMDVVSVSGTTAQVRRGMGGSRASTHASGAVVYVASSSQKAGVFRSDQRPGGTCTRANEPFLPQIDAAAGVIWDCVAPGGAKTPTGYWTRLNAAPAGFNGHLQVGGDAHINGHLYVREEFDQGFIVAENDATGLLIKSVSDTDDNVVIGSPLGLISYREEQAKTASSWAIVDGKLNIEADNTTDNEGVEIVFGGDGANTTEGVIVAGTSGGCFTASITITDISGTDQVLIGWRQNETWQDAAAFDGYTVWHTIGVTATDGSITSKAEVSSATGTDDTTVDWADGETRLLRSCVSKAGVFSAFYSAAGGSTFSAVTMTNSGKTATAGVQMYPFLSYLAAGTDGPGPIYVNWVEISAPPQ
ncbi:MAG TPA: hypothetical protein VEC57_15115 [Candidatus Limnocylindrales bacterium]|nr:hypothetical protein [Candidatus Limnocylindrales bacterium]